MESTLYQFTDSGRKYQVVGHTHEFYPAQMDYSRSPCPALNAMANHGYIARDGKNLSASEIIHGLRACYGLSWPFSIILTLVSFLLLRHFGRIDLHEIGKHGYIEHNASLVHHDAREGEIYASIEPDPELIEALMLDVRSVNEEEFQISKEIFVEPHQVLLNATAVARARIRRERESGSIDVLHAEIARGEMAMVLEMWETESDGRIGVPIDWVTEWLGRERLPKDWKPMRVLSLINVMKRSHSILSNVKQMRAEEKAD